MADNRNAEQAEPHKRWVAQVALVSPANWTEADVVAEFGRMNLSVGHGLWLQGPLREVRDGDLPPASTIPHITEPSMPHRILTQEMGKP